MLILEATLIFNLLIASNSLDLAYLCYEIDKLVYFSVFMFLCAILHTQCDYVSVCVLIWVLW